MHQPRNSLGSFSPLSVSPPPIPCCVFYFLIPTCFCFVHRFLCVFIPTLHFYFSMLMFYISNLTLVWWFSLFVSFHLCLSIRTFSHLLIMFPVHVVLFALNGHLLLQFLSSLPSFIEWPLSYDHLSLLPLLFPLPSFSISLGGPAFLPGFSRPRCENWRWRGRRRRRRRRSGNQRSRPQSLFLWHFLWYLAPQWNPPPNYRPSLPTISSSTS